MSYYPKVPFIDDVDVFDNEVRIMFSVDANLKLSIIEAATAEAVWEHTSPTFTINDVRYFEFELSEGIEPDSPEAEEELKWQIETFRESITLDSLTAEKGLFDKELRELTPLVATELAFWANELATR